MVIVGTIIVLLASVVNDWCAAHSFADPANRPPAYQRHGAQIQIASILLFAVGAALIWRGHGGVWLLAGAILWFFFFSGAFNFPLLTSVGLISTTPAPSDTYRRQVLVDERHFPAGWEGVLAGADSTHKGNLNQQINDFFVPDGISPLAFSANMAALTGQPTEECPPTASVALSGAEAAHAGNADSGLIARTTAPSGYPTWFLAAYPDVALWMNRKVEGNDDQAVLHALAWISTAGKSANASM